MEAMDTFQLPPPPLPDFISSPRNPDQLSIADGSSGFQSQAVSPWPNSTPCPTTSLTTMSTSTMLTNSNINTSTNSNNCSTNSRASPTTFTEYTPPHPTTTCHLLPPSSSSPNQQIQQQQQQQQQQSHVGQLSQPQQLPDMVPAKVVEEFEKIMTDENDNVVLTNSVCLLFRFSIDSVGGSEVCQAMSASPIIMNRLYYVLTADQFKDDDLILCYATGNLTNISKYEEGRAAILGCYGQLFSPHYNQPSRGVESLMRSLQSRDSNVVIFAITAIHNLLLDRRVRLQEIAKGQIKHGLEFIVQLLDDRCMIHNYEFKVIVLDCLQILAYGDRENRLAIKKSGGAYLLLNTIKKNFDNQPTEELIETASRVLKSLSACPANKIDIIENGGINILTVCIKRNNHEILKTCLWTLRNLSDLINNSDQDHSYCINHLVERLLHILDEYAEEPCIITCALGILANLTCNNEAIKQFICEYNGIDLLLNTIDIALRDGRDLNDVDKEILEPAVCALCHLMNQKHNPNLAEDVKRTIAKRYDLFRAIKSPYRRISDDLLKAVKRLDNLVGFTNHESF